MNYFQAIHSLIVIKENHILKGQNISKSIFYGTIFQKWTQNLYLKFRVNFAFIFDFMKHNFWNILTTAPRDDFWFYVSVLQLLLQQIQIISISPLFTYLIFGLLTLPNFLSIHNFKILNAGQMKTITKRKKKKDRQKCDRIFYACSFFLGWK